jgi:hypothetical protein
MLDSPNNGYSWSVGAFEHGKLPKYSSCFAKAELDVGKCTMVFQVVSTRFD